MVRGQFTAGNTVSIGGANPAAVAVADLNSDGFPDLAIVNTGSGTVAVFLSAAGGAFPGSPSSTLAVGNAPATIRIGDLNGDGYPDLAVANSGSNSVSIFLGSRNGAFTPSPMGPVAAGIRPQSIWIADWNADGRPDLAIANTGSSDLTVLIGNGSGSFSPAAGGAVRLPAPPVALVSADFDGDGRPDLAVALDNGAVAVLYGSGNGAFSMNPSGPIQIGAAPSFIAVADLNGDGRPDLVVSSASPPSLKVLLNLPAGFSLSSIALVDRPQSVLAADVNGDGATDLLVLSSTAANLSILYGAGDGTFKAPAIATATFPGPGAFAIGDWNGDGQPDLVAVGGSMGLASFFLNSLPALNISPLQLDFHGVPGQTGAPAATLKVTSRSGSPSVTVTANQPWVMVSPASGGVSVSPAAGTLLAGTYRAQIHATAPGYFGATSRVLWSLATPTGTLASMGSFSTDIAPAAIAVADFNHDGKLDIAVANLEAGTVTLLQGDGSGNFAPASNSPLTTGLSPRAMVAADFNNDSFPDLAVANENDGTVTILLGTATGDFHPANGSPFRAGVQPSSLVAADLNGDGVLDLAAVSPVAGTVTVLPGNGFGGFSPGISFNVGNGPNSGIAADFNSDGRIDLAITTTHVEGVTVLLNSGGGAFLPVTLTPIPAGAYPQGLIAADFNGDGALDLAVANADSSNVSILLGTGTGLFTAAATIPVGAGSFPYSLTTADFNGDGKLDLAVAGNGASAVCLLFGNGSGGFSVAPNSYPVGSGPFGIATADFNADGRPDLATVNYLDNSVSVLAGSPVPSTLVLRGTTGAQNLSATLTAQVTAAAPSFASPGGSVKFMDGTRSVASVPLSGGAASYTGTMPAGDHALSAAYSGDGRTSPSVSNVISFYTLGPPAALGIIAGSPQSTAVRGAFAVPFQIVVNDAGQHPVAAVPVTFTAPSTGASGTFTGSTTVITDANGMAKAPPFMANATAGSYSVVVTAGSLSALFQLTNTFRGAAVGIFQSSGMWLLDANANGSVDSSPADKQYTFVGLLPGDVPVTGDWNGDGRTKIGIYRQGFWILDYNGNGVFDAGDKFYGFGGPIADFQPVTGDWNGDGRTKIGYYYHGFWALDYNGNGGWDGTPVDRFYAWGGNPGETPLVGDWNGDGRSKVGYYFNGSWLLDYDGDGRFTAADKFFHFGIQTGDQPIVGDWSGNGLTKVGVYNGGFWLLDDNGNGRYDPGTDRFLALGAAPGEKPLVADWNGDGRTKIGIYNHGFWALDYTGNGHWSVQNGDKFYLFGGAPTDQPVVGKW